MRRLSRCNEHFKIIKRGIVEGWDSRARLTTQRKHGAFAIVRFEQSVLPSTVVGGVSHRNVTILSSTKPTVYELKSSQITVKFRTPRDDCTFVTDAFRSSRSRRPGDRYPASPGRPRPGQFATRWVYATVVGKLSAAKALVDDFRGKSASGRVGGLFWKRARLCGVEPLCLLRTTVVSMFSGFNSIIANLSIRRWL